MIAPSSAGTYYYGACVDPVPGESATGNNCSSGVPVRVAAAPQGEATFDLDSNNTFPTGITFANGRFYVVDTLSGLFLGFGNVYAYTASGQRDASADFRLARNNGIPNGITFANGRFYVVDMVDLEDLFNPVDCKVYAYTASGQRDASADFDLDSPCDGITFANDRFYVVDGRGDKVYAYTASGQRDFSAGFDLDPDSSAAGGITFANGRFNVVGGPNLVDGGGAKVYAYTASGQRDAAADFDLHPDQFKPTGITFANGRFHVVEFGESKVYAYPPPARLVGGSGATGAPELVAQTASVSNSNLDERRHSP